MHSREALLAMHACQPIQFVPHRYAHFPSCIRANLSQLAIQSTWLQIPRGSRRQLLRPLLIGRAYVFVHVLGCEYQDAFIEFDLYTEMSVWLLAQETWIYISFVLFDMYIESVDLKFRNMDLDKFCAV
jgi:hypothetical protein